MPLYSDDERGPFWEGCFFDLASRITLTGLDPGWLAIPSRPGDEVFACATAVHEEYIATRNCPLDARHQTDSVLTAIEVDLYGGGLGPVVPNIDHLLIREDIADKLWASELTGYELIPVTVNVDQSRATGNIFAVSYRGPDITKDRIFLPPDSNRCQYCEHGPIICSACGHTEWSCPRCKTKCVVTGTSARQDKIVQTPIPDAGVVIDGNKYDGGDFFSAPAACAVSSRVFRFFRELGGPLAVQPLRTCIDGCSEQQLSKLAKLRLSR